jgi:hypothetical protein
VLGLGLGLARPDSCLQLSTVGTIVQTRQHRTFASISEGLKRLSVDVHTGTMDCSHPVSGFPVCAVSEKNPGNSHVPTIRVRLRSSSSVYIRAMLEEQLDDIHTSATGCHTQWCFLLVEPPSVYVLRTTDDWKLHDVACHKRQHTAMGLP